MKLDCDRVIIIESVKMKITIRLIIIIAIIEERNLDPHKGP